MPLQEEVAFFMVWFDPDLPVLRIHLNNTGPTARLTARCYCDQWTSLLVAEAWTSLLVAEAWTSLLVAPIREFKFHDSDAVSANSI